jgi:hypothetical protein
MASSNCFRLRQGASLRTAIMPWSIPSPATQRTSPASARPYLPCAG